MHRRTFGLAAAVGVFTLAACGDSASTSGNDFPVETGGGSGTANTGSGGSGGNATGSGGSPAGSGGSVGSGGNNAGSGGGSGTMVTTDAGSGGGSGDPITKVVPTAGCGKDPGQAVGMAVRGTIDTMGTKPMGCADQTCGAWMYTREYFVTLPTGYVNTKAHPLVFLGPGCGGKGTDIYPLNNNVDQTVIRVGLTPPPNAIGHATNPNQGCFDDKEGDDSVDWVMYEALWDKLATTLCFDKNRVFAAGNSSGAWFSNEVACKYAGDATHPIRAAMPNTGGLPTDVRYVPTCTTKPMAGMWVHETGDTTNGFAGNKVAIARAMKVNGCTIGDSYDNTMFDNYPIGGGNPDTTCKKIKGCPELYPLVVCPLPGNGHGSHDSVANPGFATFIKQFSAGPFLTQ